LESERYQSPQMKLYATRPQRYTDPCDEKDWHEMKVLGLPASKRAYDQVGAQRMMYGVLYRMIK
jgi:hypothetical protein